MADRPAGQAVRLYKVFAALVRAYQFRDRDDICCHGISVSQCYALDVLGAQGPRTMGELAGDLYLEVSSMTRAIDPLVAAGLVARVADERDRRVRRVRITPRGQRLRRTIQADLVREYEQVLSGIAPESRSAVIQALAALLEAFQRRQQRRAVEEGQGSCAAADCTSSSTDPPAIRSGRAKPVQRPRAKPVQRPIAGRPPRGMGTA